jgi:hypothetical protein
MHAPRPLSGSPVSRRGFLASAAGAAGGLFAFPHLAPGRQNKAVDAQRVEEVVEKGLEYLKRTQAQDGHWEAPGGAYPAAMTGIAGLAMLMEGSNLKEGKYSDQIKKAVDWLISPAVQQPNGMIASRRGSEFHSYIHGHGFALTFLASAYGECEDREQQEKLEKAVKKAVEFTCKAQTHRKHRKPEGKEVEIGGWGYVSAADGNNFDEGSTTVTQMQALRAARNAAIAVPKETLDKAMAYLEACTTPRGGVIYNYGQAVNGSERPPITAAALACACSAGQYKGELVAKWVKYCKETIPIAKGRVAHDEYQNYYFGQFVYMLGDDRYGDLFPKEDKSTWLTWSKYKEAMFPYLIEQQSKTTGEWSPGGGYGIGPVFATGVNLTILQLEKGILPIYQR